MGSHDSSIFSINVFNWCIMRETLILAFLVVLGYVIGLLTSIYFPSIFIYLIQVNYLVFKGDYISLLTSIFVTNSLLDAGFNTIALLVIYSLFGSKAGKMEYIVFFFSGLLGNIFSLFLFPPNTASAGASGGIFGILSFYIIYDMLKDRKFDLYEFLILVIVFVLSDILPNVDYFAHIGGILGGVILAFIASWLKRDGEGRYTL
ncbi:rhomboid family intramembrane serine protease [Acidianus ambivalens]|uniref:Rhomboid family intramembrane serine protease n=2 Tax=Acidianus ambivalens TaxID=2283 RepID=A0A650CY32_ACIAM|nr:rhomboid family intramembrane serine protease [Acidianus ambivalens]QGR22750.1 rhomboid family intramembrane serine protease [Acidianus ambivalens]